MSKQALFNKGDRTIQTAEGDLKPKGHGAFSEKLAARLLKLYPDEVILQSAAAGAGLTGKTGNEEGNDDTGEKSVDKLTVAELKAELDAAEEEYPADALKPALVELVKKLRESTDA